MNTYTQSDFEMAHAIRTAICIVFGVLFAVAVLINVLGQPLINVLFPFWN
ncbi:hypothetical protein [Paraburkholderia tagetis]|uniref:Uncharacterized protein n=1 Tax=Paraburkholderia tagetis TaxID=2913261 RepID=A0A9X1RMG3_9BURK|nr:hypothetical protein [Paraburkholderia tagetis]MCG5072242.1 hypothetical protein [Paraburkholderia tagetis]